MCIAPTAAYPEPAKAPMMQQQAKTPKPRDAMGAGDRAMKKRKSATSTVMTRAGSPDRSGRKTALGQ